MCPAAPGHYPCALVFSYEDTVGGLTLNLGWPPLEVLCLSPSKVLVVTVLCQEDERTCFHPSQCQNVLTSIQFTGHLNLLAAIAN